MSSDVHRRKLYVLTSYLDPEIDTAHRATIQAELDAFIPRMPRDMDLLKYLLRGPVGVKLSSIHSYLDAVGPDLLDADSSDDISHSNLYDLVDFASFSSQDRCGLVDLLNARSTAPACEGQIRLLLKIACDSGDLAFYRKIREIPGACRDLISRLVADNAMLRFLPAGAGDLATHILDTIPLCVLGPKSIGMNDLRGLALAMGRGWSAARSLEVHRAQRGQDAWSALLLDTLSSSHNSLALMQRLKDPCEVLALKPRDLRFILCGPNRQDRKNARKRESRAKQRANLRALGREIPAPLAAENDP